jgi:DtxR family transcriptional regulator, Mn-dependent transcriptional regulator
MSPSQTVEDYLKAIYLGQMASPPDGLVAMGQLAAGLDVAPSTATTMVKTLAESGLAHYEPYKGVRLTASGQKLASRVLRRHRLIELFLVKVLDMSWADVHDEAERLEHAFSDQLIERIDDMLGHPAVDPHGDPIPTGRGALARPAHLDLLSAPIGTSLVVTRVVDQRPTFLRFAEQHELVPGRTVAVEARESTADAVRLRLASGDHVILGERAAANVLVRLA